MKDTKTNQKSILDPTEAQQSGSLKDTSIASLLRRGVRRSTVCRIYGISELPPSRALDEAEARLLADLEESLVTTAQGFRKGDPKLLLALLRLHDPDGWGAIALPEAPKTTVSDEKLSPEALDALKLLAKMKGTDS